MEQNDAIIGQGVEPANIQNDQNQSNTTKEEGQSTMESLLSQEGAGFDFPKQGEVRTGVIASIGENEILVSVGTKSEGIINGKELEQIPAEERAAFQVGTEIPVYVIIPEDANGNVVLSLAHASGAIGITPMNCSNRGTQLKVQSLAITREGCWCL
jgi:small subunit ribosomal protein S1